MNGLKCQKRKLGEPDTSGRARPILIEDSEFVLPVKNVVLAIGTIPNPLVFAGGAAITRAVQVIHKAFAPHN